MIFRTVLFSRLIRSSEILLEARTERPSIFKYEMTSVIHGQITILMITQTDVDMYIYSYMTTIVIHK